MSYECHITIVNPEEIDHFRRLVEFGEEWGWKTSWIERDPLLGDDVFFYFTRHSGDAGELQAEMQLVSGVLQKMGYPVLREKIEHIVFDTKTDTTPNLVEVVEA